MNYRLIIRLLGSILSLEALLMLPSLMIALYCGDGDAMAFVYSILITFFVSLPGMLLSHPEKTDLRLKESFVTVALAWILLSLFGALPFVFSGALPTYADAIFEAVSGLTTTGATVMPIIDGQMRGILFWRSFTHWIGGMGVLVLTLAILPSGVGRASQLMRAEAPGPEFSKLLPKTGNSAKLLYFIYAIMTVIEFLLLLACGLTPYDAAIHALSTACTGGFSSYGQSVGAFHSPIVEWVITLFMVLFSVNFAIYYRALTGHLRDALRSEELHWFLAIFFGASILITLNILPMYDGFGESLRTALFQVASIISTTGFATTDFNLWPLASKLLILMLMFIGACAGSTAGGLKVVRVALLTKHGLKAVRSSFQPRHVSAVRFEGRGIDRQMLQQIAVFFFVYIAILLIGTFLVSLDDLYGFETTFTAVLTCLSNVGPGFGAVGPTGSFAGYGAVNKLLFSLLMLAGRLEFFPILALFHPDLWRKAN